MSSKYWRFQPPHVGKALLRRRNVYTTPASPVTSRHVLSCSVPSRLILSPPAISWNVFFHPVLSCPFRPLLILSCSLSCPLLSCTVLSCHVFSSSRSLPPRQVLSLPALSCPFLFHPFPSCPIPLQFQQIHEPESYPREWLYSGYRFYTNTTLYASLYRRAVRCSGDDGSGQGGQVGWTDVCIIHQGLIMNEPTTTSRFPHSVSS